MAFQPTGEKTDLLVNDIQKLDSYLEKDKTEPAPPPIYQTQLWKYLKSKVKTATTQGPEVNMDEFLYIWE